MLNRETPTVPRLHHKLVKCSDSSKPSVQAKYSGNVFKTMHWLVRLCETMVGDERRNTGQAVQWKKFTTEFVRAGREKQRGAPETLALTTSITLISLTIAGRIPTLNWYSSITYPVT